MESRGGVRHLNSLKRPKDEQLIGAPQMRAAMRMEIDYGMRDAFWHSLVSPGPGAREQGTARQRVLSLKGRSGFASAIYTSLRSQKPRP